MEVYLYCSYEHSRTGFFMTHLKDNQLLPITDVPEIVGDFFSYDRFRVLWYDMCSEDKKQFWKPKPEGMFFGIRNIFGEMADGRKCTANLLIITNADEIPDLRRIALSVLGDYPAFEGQFSGWLRAGGSSYELNIGAFSGWIDAYRKTDTLHRFISSKSRASNLLPWMQRAKDPYLETDLLRLAVYTSAWQDIQQTMGNGMAWRIKHPCALDVEEFENIFIREAPLWELL